MSDLQDANVGDACGLSDGAQARPVPDSLQDCLAPSSFGSAAPRGCAAHAGQIVHLERGEVAEHRHVRPDDEAGARVGVAMRPGGAERFAGFGCEPLPLGVAHGANVGLKGRCKSGHIGKDTYRNIICQASGRDFFRGEA